MLRRIFKSEPRGQEPRDRAPAPEAGAGPADAAGRDSHRDRSAELEQALARADAAADVDALIEVALQARGSIRHAALDNPRLRQADALAALEKRTRHHDKSLNRHARRLLDECRRLRADAEAAAGRAAELAGALGRKDPAEAAAGSAMDRAAIERQHELHRRLTEALDRHGELRAALAPFGDQIADLEHLRVDPSELPALDPVAPPSGGADADTGSDGAVDPSANHGAFDALVTGFRELDRDMIRGAEFETLAAQRQSLTDQWLTCADHAPPSTAQHEVFETVSHRFRELADAAARLGQAAVPDLPDAPLLIEPGHPDHDRQAAWRAIEAHRGLLQRLEKARRNVRWPGWAAPSPALQRLTQGIETLGREIEAADQALATELDTLDGELSALGNAIDEGHLGQAQSLLSQARSHLDALPAAAARRAGRQVGQQAARLAELKDWQTFATTPKREQLAAAMEALAGEPLPAPEQADRIKALRADWQALGPVTQATDGRLADRFNALAEQAFEPCRAYFAELAESRKHNLAERRRICDQLESYLAETDWQHTDMKAAERIMRAARDEWRHFHPVDRQPGRKVEARFEKLQSALHDRVKAEWDRNLAAKTAIVAEAEALVNGDLPPHERVNAAKALQSRWRAVGITPRRPDQQLWRAFRAACDAVFAARDEARHAADQAREAQAAAIAAELDRFEASLNDPAVIPSAAAARNLNQSTAGIDALPPGQGRSLQQRRRELLQRHSDRLAEQDRQQQRQRLQAAREWDEHMARAEQQGAAAAGDDAPLPDAVVKARLAAAAGTVPLTRLHRLTVRAELAAALDSPPADEPLRLELQVERLQAGLGGGKGGRGASPGPSANDLPSLLHAWCELGPKDPAVDALRERFFTALERLGAVTEPPRSR